ncbi:MAG: GTP 3',8-cyclase MoaA [Burkholderiaceae bacterium]
MLSQQARTLKNAGLDRLTVSLDAMNPEVFQRMNDSAISIGRVLEGIAAAENAGFNAININVVVRKGQNEDQIAPIALHFKSTHHVPRFIEFMDVGNTNGWQIDQVIPSTEVRSIVQRFVAPLSRIGFSGVAERWAYDDGTGQVDFISSVTQAFCNTCTRLRLSADGQLFTCLFARHGHDIRASLRSKDSFASESNGGLEAQISNIWQHRTDRYSAQRLHQPQRLARVEMSYIGG